MNKKKILFVDDDEKLLQGLQRGLRSTREEWDLFFAPNAEAALELLEKEAIDLVVADIRMPGIDGCTFLQRVRELFPKALRVVLSGETGQGVGAKALQVANQCLSKPCSIKDLKNSLTELLINQDRLGSGLLKEAVARLDVLPSLPQNYNRLRDKLKDPDSSIDDISRIISQDMAIVAKILQLANSAYYGVSAARITNLPRAISRIGLGLVGQLSLAMHLFSAYDKKKCPRFSIDQLWDQSLEVSQLAGKIAQEEKCSKEFVETVMLGGLLHDVGKLVLATCLGKEYDAFLAEKLKEGELELNREEQVFGTTHPKVGAYMVGIWGLPPSIVDSVNCHHHPEKCLKAEEPVPQALVVAAAAALVRKEEGDDFARCTGLVEGTSLQSKWERWKTLK